MLSRDLSGFQSYLHLKCNANSILVEYIIVRLNLVFLLLRWASQGKPLKDLIAPNNLGNTKLGVITGTGQMRITTHKIAYKLPNQLKSKNLSLVKLRIFSTKKYE